MTFDEMYDAVLAKWPGPLRGDLDPEGLELTCLAADEPRSRIITLVFRGGVWKADT
jgi:hypothetical protein